MNVLPASISLAPNDHKRDWLVIVQDDGVDVIVRWTIGRHDCWRCSECGRSQVADCAHTFAAGLLLAEHLLGLTRLPELRETA